MTELFKYLRWDAKRRLYAARIFLLIWFALDLIVFALPQAACRWITFHAPFLTALFNILLALAGFGFLFYPAFILSASWFRPRRTMEQLTGISTKKQIVSGLLLNIPSALLLFLQSQIGSALMQKFARGGMSYFHLTFSEAAGFLPTFFNLMVFIPCLYLFFYLAIGKPGGNIPAFLLAYIFSPDITVLSQIFLPASLAPAADLVTALVKIVLTVAMVLGAARIAEKRGY